jgi:NHL repeat
LSCLAGGDWGYADGQGVQAKFGYLHGGAFAWSSDDKLLVTDAGSSVRTITADGTVRTLAGGADKGFRDGRALEARFNGASGVAVGTAGDIYVADSDNRRIRKITLQGEVSTVAGTGRRGTENGSALKATFADPVGVALGRDGILYVLDYPTEHPQVRRIGTDGMVSTLAKTQ